jgi:translation initiation factor IF-2
MAAKPRVHEIASELKLDSKVLIGTIRDMGEHVKGPSSSIEPPVARRLRTAFTAKQAQVRPIRCAYCDEYSLPPCVCF